jgi:hypothetical protein
LTKTAKCWRDGQYGKNSFRISANWIRGHQHSTGHKKWQVPQWLHLSQFQCNPQAMKGKPNSSNSRAFLNKKARPKLHTHALEVSLSYMTLACSWMVGRTIKSITQGHRQDGHWRMIYWKISFRSGPPVYLELIGTPPGGAVMILALPQGRAHIKELCHLLG